MIKKGQLDGAVKQVDSSYVIKNDGTIEASLTFTADVQDIDDFPDIDDDHPDDFRLQCYNKNVTYAAAELVTCTCSYFGIEGTKTEPVVSYDGGTNNDPIETHPNFGETGEAGLAGTVNAPLNGAKFVSDPEADDYGSFIKFSGDDAGELLGVQYYLTPANNVSVSYWTTRKPNLNRRMDVVTLPEIGRKTFYKPPNVKNYLLVDMPYRTQGNLYQVTEQYMGSASGGWNRTIYP